MALDPFAGLRQEAAKRGYDPLAIMAGIGIGQTKGAELSMERQRQQAEAEQRAADLQLRARQMEQEAAANAQRRQFEMQQLGLTQKQQEASAAAEQRRLDQAMAEAQANEAYRQKALEQAQTLATQQQAATAEQARLTREAAATAAERQQAASSQEKLWTILGTLGAANKLTPALMTKVGKGELTGQDLLAAMASPAPAKEAPKLSDELVLDLFKPIEEEVPVLDASGKQAEDVMGKPLTRKVVRYKTPEEQRQQLLFYQILGRMPAGLIPTLAPRSAGTSGAAGPSGSALSRLRTKGGL